MNKKIREELLMWLALVVLGAGLFALLYGLHSYLPNQKVYDCRMAEISPDVPVKVKEECRKRRLQ